MRSDRDPEVCVKEIGADGTVGATLILWNHYGTLCGDYDKPSDYTPATIAVETTATRFKVSVRHTVSFDYFAGLAILRATGAAAAAPSAVRDDEDEDVASPLGAAEASGESDDDEEDLEELKKYNIQHRYQQLEHFKTRGCVKAEHESTAKEAVWVRTLGLGASRGEETVTLLRQVLQKTNVRLMIWQCFSIDHEVMLPVSISSPATSTMSFREDPDVGGYACDADPDVPEEYAAESMLAGEVCWMKMDEVVEASIEFSVPHGSSVKAIEAATWMASSKVCDMRVEEVNIDGTPGEELFGWACCGEVRVDALSLDETDLAKQFIASDDLKQLSIWIQASKPSSYIPATIAVDTRATRFKVSIRVGEMEGEAGLDSAGLAIFRAIGIAAAEKK